MKFMLLVILMLALMGSCQPVRSKGASDINHVLKENYDFSLLALQYLTAELKVKGGIWAETQADYVRAYGDTAGIVLADFERINFGTSGDSLEIHYLLKSSRKEYEPLIQFISLQAGLDTSTVQFDQTVHQLKHSSPCMVNEGKLVFFQGASLEIAIIHTYCGGIARNKITYAHH